MFSQCDGNSELRRWAKLINPLVEDTRGYGVALPRPDLDGSLYWYNVSPSVYEYEIALPGVKKEHINVACEKNVLHVSIDSNNKSKHVLLSKHAIQIPKDADTSSLTSTYVDGLLRVTCNRVQDERLKRRTIEVT
jgi:hypothetical protein